MKALRPSPFAMLLLSIALATASGSAAGDGEHVVRSESQIFSMDRVYKSMFGPKETDRLRLLATDEQDTLWITAIRADVVGADGETPESPEYFCHSVLTRVNSRPASFLRDHGLSVQNPKLFTLVQGLNEIRFPKGFGIPVHSYDRFDSTVMVMNPTEPEVPVRVGVDSRIEYVRASELEQPMKPLFLVPLVVRVPVTTGKTAHIDLDGHGDEHASHEGLTGHGDDHAGHEHGADESCIPADDQAETARSVERTGNQSPITRGESGEKLTGHWYVPPGRHVYRHRLGKLDDRIRFDTRIHYIATHLHPFGESLELIDLTAGRTVFKATASNFPDRVAVREISHYASSEGLEIDRHHEHEIVAVYDNTTDHDVDSMAVMYLYLHDSYLSEARATTTSGGR